VIIVSYNGRQHLENCLRAVQAQQDVTFECILVDNGSTDGSAAFVRERFPWVKVVESDKNLGFAGGNNRGAAEARGGFLAFLNNDTRAEPTWLSALRDGLGGASDVGVVTSRIVYMDDPMRLDSAGDGFTRAGGAFKHGHGAPANGYAERREVFGACGAACLLRRAVYEEVGGFDEDFFASHEDVDLSYRLRLRGYRCLYVPEAVVLHAGSATLGHASETSVYYGQRNLEWVYVKNTPLKLLLVTLPLHVGYLVAATAYFAWIGRLPSFAAAKWAALRGLPAVLRKRRAIQRQRTASDAAIWDALEPGWIGLKMREKRYERFQGSKVPKF
jgi:GT2 family glycosyltransferase